MDTFGLLVGITGGIGLGLLMGSEYSHRYVTLFGAVLAGITIVIIAISKLKSKKCNE